MSPPQTIAHYRLTSKIGQGGMGEVWRATDTKLGRDVAVKILPEAFAQDAERMARFTREAQVLASLNHPNIAAIYGFEDRALIMELVEGPTLAERITAGPMPLEEALPIARQIAEALEDAHERGIYHRDLKPANIKITPEGVVKVLDFGLAKAADDRIASGDPSASPTLTLAATRAGVILGTAAYMSPEQASGRPVDKRTDVWSFGVVLWEMLCGRKLFEGETISHTLADVLRADVDLSKLPSATPAVIRELLGRCLERNPKLRLRDIGEARVAIRKYLDHPDASAATTAPPAVAAPPPARRAAAPWAVAAILLALLVGMAAIHFRERPADVYPVRFLAPQPEKMTLQWYDMPVISPDGRHLAFTGASGVSAISPTTNLLWVRPLDSTEARSLPGTEGAYFPFWSPDSRSVAFFARGILKKIDLTGGPPLTLCEDSQGAGGGTWNREGVILFGSGSGPLFRVSAVGGDPKPLAPLDKSRQETAHMWPRFLPDGKHYLYLARSSDPGKTGVYVAALDSGDPKFVINSETNATYVPPGHLLFTRQETLFAQRFDLGKLELRGDPIPIADGVGRMTSLSPGSLYSVSDNGVLAYRSGNSPNLRLVWYDRSGKRLEAAGEPGPYRQITLSPDGARLAVERQDLKTGRWDIWLLELRSGILSRFTFDAATDSDPAWSPDSRQIVFNSDRKGHLDLYRKVVGGSDEELLFENSERKVPEDWLKDDSILFANLQGKTFYRLPLTGERKPEVLFQSEFVKDETHVSPDQRWIVYCSNESGRWEVYIASFPKFTDRRQVSTGGGGQPIWRKDSKELFYFSLDGKMMSVDVKAGATIETGVPKVLLETRLRPIPSLDQYAVTPDGSRFIVTEPVEETAKPTTVVLNWTAKLPR